MANLDKIETIVVLMLENGSFDHKLGFLKSAAYPIEGLDGTETVPVDPDPASPRVAVNDGANYRGDFHVDPGNDATFIDPAHDVDAVRNQLFGPIPGAVPTNQGFIWDYRQQKSKAGPNTDQHAQNIVRCFSPDKLPVLTTLAQEFAVCDHWFSSVPGPTWPNRIFVHAATSGGQIDNNLHEDAYNIYTIYDRLEKAGFSWRIYFHDFPQSIALTHLQKEFIAPLKRRYKLIDDFFDDARTGHLPAYSFIEPRYTDFLSLKANDQHPPHDVALGEFLIADVYEAIRNSPQWEQSLLVILWDEHGGIYDHVPPPNTVNPDGKTVPDCDFTLLGVRVPAVLVSPYISKGTIDSLVYDHTSLLATVEKRFGLQPLTRRDAQANTFEGVFSLAAPRTDAPTQLPRPTDPISQAAYDESQKHVADMGADAIKNALREGNFAGVAATEFQTSLVKLTKNLVIKGEQDIQKNLRLSQWAETEHDAAQQVRDFATKFFKHLF